ncbi:hypothetical protein LCM20_12595 [Halobacillus litoralis]|uniref:hypothetical protein n=1 Tax=Halobacillus litoralis TaxID=45668 RepID=UPI001CD45399|nr:hypothetical protein [Halobacillus litoralis]MCA0971436.1 hypothetical protein [Halobacillus litoralis]
MEPIWTFVIFIVLLAGCFIIYRQNSDEVPKWWVFTAPIVPSVGLTIQILFDIGLFDWFSGMILIEMVKFVGVLVAFSTITPVFYAMGVGIVFFEMKMLLALKKKWKDDRAA